MQESLLSAGLRSSAMLLHRPFFGALILAGAASLTKAQGFEPGCTLPFDAIKHHHPIDDTCPRRGNVPDPPPASGPNGPAHALQNEAKNNFCATGDAALVTFFSFKKLQQKLDQKAPEARHWTRTSLPADRSVLSDVFTTSEGDTIGEGNVVRFAAWVMMLRGNSVESCNCETSAKNEDTDIHVVLIANSDRENTEECSSVTAEVSPHFRPETWDSHHLLQANAHPLRFTGQLFYDAAHRPCSGNPPKAASRPPPPRLELGGSPRLRDRRLQEEEFGELQSGRRLCVGVVGGVLGPLGDRPVMGLRNATLRSIHSIRKILTRQSESPSAGAPMAQMPRGDDVVMALVEEWDVPGQQLKPAQVRSATAGPFNISAAYAGATLTAPLTVQAATADHSPADPAARA